MFLVKTLLFIILTSVVAICFSSLIICSNNPEVTICDNKALEPVTSKPATNNDIKIIDHGGKASDMTMRQFYAASALANLALRYPKDWARGPAVCEQAFQLADYMIAHENQRKVKK